MKPCDGSRQQCESTMRHIQELEAEVKRLEAEIKDHKVWAEHFARDPKNGAILHLTKQLDESQKRIEVLEGAAKRVISDYDDNFDDRWLDEAINYHLRKALKGGEA